MSPKQFLQIGGIVLLLVGTLGFVGVLGPSPEQSIFKDAWWFDNGENWAHTLLGIVALIAAYALKDQSMQKWLVMLVGFVGLLVGLIGFFLSSDVPNFLGANLENPADNILHVIVGAWALWASTKKGA